MLGDADMRVAQCELYLKLKGATKVHHLKYNNHLIDLIAYYPDFIGFYHVYRKNERGISYELKSTAVLVSTWADGFDGVRFRFFVARKNADNSYKMKWVRS